MTSYRVGFDGKWQEHFDEQADAVEWAKEVAETGRVVYVDERRWYRTKLVKVFPRGGDASQLTAGPESERVSAFFDSHPKIDAFLDDFGGPLLIIGVVAFFAVLGYLGVQW